MIEKGALVDPKFQYDEKAVSKFTGNSFTTPDGRISGKIYDVQGGATVDLKKANRKVLQSDIDKLHLDKLSYVGNALLSISSIGYLTNQYHEKKK